GVVPHATDHENVGAEARGGDRLVAALAAGGAQQILADQRLAGPGQGRQAHDQVHVQSTNDSAAQRRQPLDASLSKHMPALPLVAVPGIRVGHWTDLDAGTGCTVVLCEQAVAVGVDVRGAAPATRETDLLQPGRLVGRAHAILLTGGSAFGLDAATGVMRFLEERGIGLPTHASRVPIVSAAALFDLGFGRADVRPNAAAGYAACQAASDASVAEGCVGAGTGATVAKQRGAAGAIKGGIGSAGRVLEDGTLVAALV